MVPSSHVSGDGPRVGDRVRDVDHLQVERARPRTCSPGSTSSNRHVLELVLLDLRARHRDRQRAAVDRRADLGPARAAPTAGPRRGPRGRASARSPRCPSARSRRYVKSGSTRSIPSMLGGREHQARVHHDDPPVVLEHGHVLADLAQPAEREDAQGAASSVPRGARAAATRPSGAPPPARTSSTSTSGSRTPPVSKPSRPKRSLDGRGRRRDEERAVHVLELARRAPASAPMSPDRAPPRTAPSSARPPGARTRVMPPAPADLGERAQQVVVTGVQREPGVLDDPPRLRPCRSWPA